MVGALDELDVKEVGKLLFGRELRLKVLLYVLDRLEGFDGDGGPFFQQEAARAIEYGASAVTAELDRLIDLQMLSRAEKTPGERRLYYTPLPDSDLWDGVRAVRDALVARAATAADRDEEADAM